MKKIYIRGWHGTLPKIMREKLMALGAIELIPYFEFELNISGLDAFVQVWNDKFYLYAVNASGYDYLIGVTHHSNFGQH